MPSLTACDSIDRESVMPTLKELGLEYKTLNIIKTTITNTYTKVKFMADLSDPFEIRTGVSQGDGVSLGCSIASWTKWSVNGTEGLKVE